MYKKKILVIGSGAIVIGQACEFDYSGVQACKTFKEEKNTVVLLNNNPATVMTDNIYSDRIYLEPINLFYLEKIIKKEKPNFIYCSVGGQISLNLILDLYKKKKYKKIKLLGTDLKSIENSESRKKFKKIMLKNKLPIAFSEISNNIKDSLKIREKIIKKKKTKTVSVRPSYTLGGLGGGLSNKKKDFINICKKGLMLSKNNEIIIEESLCGYKEIELEIIVDKKLNFINICSIENIDPVGIHTGDSLCVSPIQTLTNKEFQNIRNISKKVIKYLGIKSTGANIQFALNPYLKKIIIIEVNPRLSRSSALASKATGYPIAKVSAKVSLGYSLKKIKSRIIKNLNFFYEPVIDYIVTKCPLFSIEKFGYKKIITNNQMKSVGESMSINENFESSLQNSLNNFEKSLHNESFEKKNLYKKVFYSNNDRIHNLYEFLKFGKKIKILNFLTKIDSFFLNKIKNIIILENNIKKKKITKKKLIKYKIYGFSDIKISQLKKIKFYKIFEYRIKNKILPSYNRVDNCSGEFDAFINYYYSTYCNKCEYIKKKKCIIIVGSGPNNIGQGIEFDYCCVHASFSLQKKKYNSVILNNNPETVSTDYDISNILFFLSPNFENLFNIYNKIKPFGIILQFCGQLDNFFLKNINKYNLKILGTNILDIIKTENRKKFKKIVKNMGFNQPDSFIIKNSQDFKKKNKFNFPLLLRPSYVLGGKNMKIINNKKKLKNYYLNFIKKKIIFFPIQVDKFIKNCIEIDVDGICNGIKVYIFPIIQHIEEAGIHSGDSSSFIPNLFSRNLIKKIKKISKNLVLKFKIIGSFNIQFAINLKKKIIYVIEINPRSSRTVPYLVKSTKINIIDKCISFILKKKIKIKKRKLNIFFLKKPIFSFIKFKKSDSILGPEMKSTGEIISLGKNLYFSYIKSQIQIGFNKSKKLQFINNLNFKKDLLIINLSKSNKYKKLRINLISKSTPVYTNKNSIILLFKSIIKFYNEYKILL
ncbi:carbamoyl-phosphate synthase large subunit [Candidatus Vidania fulgoroideorum]